MKLLIISMTCLKVTIPWMKKDQLNYYCKCFKGSVDLKNKSVIKIKLRARRCNKHTKAQWNVEDNEGGLCSSSLEPMVPLHQSDPSAVTIKWPFQSHHMSPWEHLSSQIQPEHCLSHCTDNNNWEKCVYKVVYKKAKTQFMLIKCAHKNSFLTHLPFKSCWHTVGCKARGT